MGARTSTSWTRTSSSAERDAQVVEMHEDGMTFAKIAEHFGWASKQTAWWHYKQALERRPSQAVDEHRARKNARLEAQYAELVEALHGEHPLVSHGKLIPGVVDYQAKVSILREMRMTVAELGRLHGTDAPTKTKIEVLTEDVADAALRVLVEEHAELARRSAGREAPADQDHAGADSGPASGAGGSGSG